MEIMNHTASQTPVRAVLFDFDGTVSTLRYGWEQVMKPLMLEMISGGKDWDEALEKEVDAFIDESTGIQTIYQMKWLAQTVHERGMNPTASADPWWYKGEYNRRLMEHIKSRIERVKSGEAAKEEYLMRGSEAFLKALCERGVKLYVASGTDHPDVLKEAEALGLKQYFTHIAGAPVHQENCSKEKVIAQLMEDEGLRGDDFAIIGDGKVEIALGKAAGARTIGLASDEDKRCGINPVKRQRLIKAGADVITGDFSEIDQILRFLGLE